MEDKRVTLDVLKVESSREDHWQPRNMEDTSITLDVLKEEGQCEEHWPYKAHIFSFKVHSEHTQKNF